jgi:hypothetical protein
MYSRQLLHWSFRLIIVADVDAQICWHWGGKVCTKGRVKYYQMNIIWLPHAALPNVGKNWLANYLAKETILYPRIANYLVRISVRSGWDPLATKFLAVNQATNTCIYYEAVSNLLKLYSTCLQIYVNLV